MMSRLLDLYKQTRGGHNMLSEDDLEEYAGLRKAEFQDARARLEAEGITDIHPVKDSSGDIIGWVYIKPHIFVVG